MLSKVCARRYFMMIEGSIDLVQLDSVMEPNEPYRSIFLFGQLVEGWDEPMDFIKSMMLEMRHSQPCLGQ